MKKVTGKAKVGWWEPVIYLPWTLLLLTLMLTAWLLISITRFFIFMSAKKVLTIIFSLVLIAAFYFGWAYNREIDLNDKTVSLIIKSGDSFSAVTARLVDSGVVASSLMLKVPARLKGIDKKLTPGRYDFSGANSCASVLERLDQADFLKIKITIPEGEPIWRVASILSNKLGCDSSEIIKMNSDSESLDEFNLPWLEGYLYPQTYYFPWGTNARDAVGEMVALYHTIVDSVWPDELNHGLSREDVIILASIVEAETRLDEERPRVASVYLNRIKKGMLLQADPTVIYGLGGLDRPLRVSELRRETPYNTYVRKGLPVTPINSPSLASIQAVLYPEDSDYLYFVADNSGGHYFSKTNAEHNRAKSRIRQEAKNQK